MTEPSTPRVLTDVEALKALAHPLRQRLLTRLQRQGAATSAELAVEFGEDRGGTSYHLRQLARFGFIEEDTERSAGRRKYWRAVPQDVRLPRRAPAGSEAGVAAAEIGRQWQQRAEADLAEFAGDREAYGAFGEAALHSYGGTHLTAEELSRFGEEYVALLSKWHRRADDAPPGARHVSVVFHAFPTP
ncbi:helix-turn-helix transcriptional regulator [Streptomyces sp. VRA16 Mangrove soil]|uniref:ArsR/SmtB family transcription factor n=1 Tax=Streptomyces sp. VRA16 Mangrove soil TaxID=2817434 RepID=UPI001A9D2179|nr:helix-turn-helix domain-containing protein [Streptomyces sp. VRA16 Mangrove soil]MBO1334169.1 helix-turn-helix transcriptional regulator [Streptomyces sp. VRA16 Mangrove soil]